MAESELDHGFFLEARQLSKSYGKGKQALDQVSFSLSEGECLGIAGHNGSGKSTLLSLVSQTMLPDAGDIQVSGVSVLQNRTFLRECVGYVPQQDGLLADITVEETLKSWQAMLRTSDTNAYSCGVEMMGLSPLLKKKISALSGGMKKRVSIVLALLGRPKLLVLDEVMAALDQSYCEAFLAYIKDFLAQGGSVLYCTHKKDELLQICNRLLVLKHGRVVFYDVLPKLGLDLSSQLFSDLH